MKKNIKKASGAKKDRVTAFKEWVSTSNGMITLSVIVATFNALLVLPTSGIIATIPLAIIISGAAALFVKQFFYIPMATFIMTSVLCNLWKTPIWLADLEGGYMMRVGLRGAVLALMGCMIAVVIKNSGRIIKSKIATGILIGVFATVGILWNAFSNGTPWGAISAKGNINDYVDANFDTRGVYASSIYYVPKTGGYSIDYKTADEEYSASASYTGDNVTESLTTMYSDVISKNAKGELTAVLRKAFPAGNFYVDCKYSGVYSNKLSLKDTDSVSKFLKYTVDIHDMSNAKSFTYQAESFFEAVMKSGFDCEELTVNGGIRGKMYYSISGNPYVPRSEAANRLSPYSKIIVPTGSLESAKNS